MAAALVVAALSAQAQQDEGPILRPKVLPVKPTGPTLLVLCDLACNWKLDGEAKGRIQAGGSAKANVVLGQHVVVATTDDGADEVKLLSEVKSSGQTAVSIELKPVRDSRLKAEQEAKDKAKPAEPAQAMLLVTCDLVCDWKLDGEMKGRIEAGGSAKVKVELGQHLVAATTEDGADQVKQLSDVKSNVQAVVSLDLKPAREARLKAEHQALEKAKPETPLPDPNDPASPHAPGIYLAVGTGADRKLVSLNSCEFKPKEKGAFVRVLGAAAGPEAKLRVPATQPEFYFYFDKRGVSYNPVTFGSASSPSDFLLLHLTVNSEEKREAFIIKVGPRRINSSDGEYIPFKFSEVGLAVYKVTLPSPLVSGEYGFLSLSNEKSDVLDLAISSQGKNPRPLWLFDFGVPGLQSDPAFAR